LVAQNEELRERHEDLEERTEQFKEQETSNDERRFVLYGYHE
jgi:hypothetical protein